MTFTFTDSGVTAAGETDTGYEIDGTALTITSSGTYTVSGSCADGSIKVKKSTTGVTLAPGQYLVTFVSDEWGTEYMHLFTVSDFTGTMRPDCDEGELRWIDKEKIGALPLWEGDKIFLRLLAEEEPFFSLKLCYRGDMLVSAKLNGRTV